MDPGPSTVVPNQMEGRKNSALTSIVCWVLNNIVLAHCFWQTGFSHRSWVRSYLVSYAFPGHPVGSSSTITPLVSRTGDANMRRRINIVDGQKGSDENGWDQHGIQWWRCRMVVETKEHILYAGLTLKTWDYQSNIFISVKKHCRFFVMTTYNPLGGAHLARITPYLWSASGLHMLWTWIHPDDELEIELLLPRLLSCSDDDILKLCPSHRHEFLRTGQQGREVQSFTSCCNLFQNVWTPIIECLGKRFSWQTDELDAQSLSCDTEMRMIGPQWKRPELKDGVTSWSLVQRYMRRGFFGWETGAREQ